MTAKKKRLSIMRNVFEKIWMFILYTLLITTLMATAFAGYICFTFGSTIHIIYAFIAWIAVLAYSYLFYAMCIKS